MINKSINNLKKIFKALTVLFELHKSMYLNHKTSLKRLADATAEERIKLLQIHQEGVRGRKKIFEDYKKMVKDAGYTKYSGGPLMWVCTIWFSYINSRYFKQEDKFYRKVVDLVFDEIEI